jgi:hypothetical protein
MAFDDLELKRIEKLVGSFCRRKCPPHLKDKVSLEYRILGHDVTIFERRPWWDGRPGFSESMVAKARYVRKVDEWRLLWQRADLKWHGYEPMPSSKDLAEVIAEIDEDPYACFFG